MDGQSSDCTVICHVRAPLLFEPIDAQVETLRTGEREGAIDSLLLRSWPKEVALTAESPHQEVIETVERFDRWADARGVSIRPPFRERSFTSQVTGETKDLLVTPVCCLEVYADDELVGVFPHSRDGETYTVADAIATLRTGDVPTPLGDPESAEPDESAAFSYAERGASKPAAPSRSVDPANEERCPECGSEAINGQGVYACTGCDWTGVITADGDYEPVVERETRPGSSAEPERTEPDRPGPV